MTNNVVHLCHLTPKGETLLNAFQAFDKVEEIIIALGHIPIENLIDLQFMIMTILKESYTNQISEEHNHDHE